MITRKVLLGSFAALAVTTRPGRAQRNTPTLATADLEAAKAALAPTGRLRVAINYGNAVLATRAPKTGMLAGVSVDIAHELGQRLGLPLTLLPFDAAGKVTEASGQDVWDVAFLARDPKRAEQITFTAPYVVIEGTYAVRKNSPISSAAGVDRTGNNVAVGKDSAYDLFLTRTLERATIIRARTTPEAVAMFHEEGLQVVAGIKQGLLQAIAVDPTLRMLPEPFMEINQAMGTPMGRPAAAAHYLGEFVESMKSSGAIATILARHGQIDAAVAPAEAGAK
jgi:polar amino acid transport system substrate-binding protein